MFSFRAAWYLLDIYFLPEHEVLSLTLGQLIGLATLMATRCLSCLHAGIYRDKAKCGVTVAYHLTSYAFVSRINSQENNNNNERGGRQT